MSHDVFVNTGLHTAILLQTKKPLQQDGVRVRRLIVCMNALCFSHTLHDSRCMEDHSMDWGVSAGAGACEGVAWAGAAAGAAISLCINWGRAL